jgi:hypothetical protein
VYFPELHTVVLSRWWDVDLLLHKSYADSLLNAGMGLPDDQLPTSNITFLSQGVQLVANTRSHVMGESGSDGSIWGLQIIWLIRCR